MINQPFADETCGDDSNSRRKLPPPHVGYSKIDVIDLVSPRVFFRGRNCDWIVINRNHALRSEARCCQSKNSSTGPKIEEHPLFVWGAHASSRAALRASRNAFREEFSARRGKSHARRVRSPAACCQLQ